MVYQEEFLQRLQYLLGKALPRWGLSADSELKLLTISENATYLVTDPDRQRHLVMRVHRPDYTTHAEIRSELAWIKALRQSGAVQTAAPVPMADGELVGVIQDGAHIRHVVAFEFVPGREPEAADNLEDWYQELGTITGRLHSHSKSWRKPAGFTRKIWDYATILGERAYWGNWRHAQGLTPDGLAILERTAALLKKQTDNFGSDPQRFGLIHCDMRLANLLVNEEKMTVIDFDDCGICWYAYDFAASVSFMEHDPRIDSFLHAWLTGYRSVAPFSEEEEKAIPMFLMLRRMQLTAWVASHAETPTAQSMGTDYTLGTLALAENYLSRHKK
ncbi:aminoglycoside phosphotransferase [Brenneria goodwinii]|uniref:Aminoglycoside phosphotransferase n=1 Tax=Brenneria goodwinii TaxID=1109412 RepID=A0A0G4JQU4_9GAMM|nr:phosphotransferase enzyme family protein [Brenneria goodwinii]ATA25258.1 aminoglycoside phosphotransferase [Brenneria goodwinii]MCG8158258.1 phosphotransferase enzyme family protein [Brenneria goodwinii]MCG8162346.1 phosphotransferase enzyme family protein [Brenneria goodwinii]MCG8167308.1 phosphotransferase enzyme family protein [Brenneria goodwinii]MCG8172024.1 phosphotransferase enzyme family protein [Brenneria goodwinii]